MPHANAPLTAAGRARLVSLVVDEDYSLRRAAKECGVSPTTAYRWVKRHREGANLEDRSSRPNNCPHQLTEEQGQRIVAIRQERRWGMFRIAREVGVATSTVERVLKRRGMPTRL